jgi:hypothetical protein
LAQDSIEIRLALRQGSAKSREPQRFLPLGPVLALWIDNSGLSAATLQTLKPVGGAPVLSFLKTGMSPKLVSRRRPARAAASNAG